MTIKETTVLLSNMFINQYGLGVGASKTFPDPFEKHRIKGENHRIKGEKHRMKGERFRVRVRQCGRIVCGKVASLIINCIKSLITGRSP